MSDDDDWGLTMSNSPTTTTDDVLFWITTTAMACVALYTIVYLATL